jgi:outer membrane biosynthesis protein TonB
MRNANFIPDLYQSINGISSIFVAICKHENWVDHLDVTEKDKRKFHDLFEPYIDSIRSFFNASVRGISGGSLPPTIRTQSNAPSTEQVAAEAPTEAQPEAPTEAPTEEEPEGQEAPEAPKAEEAKSDPISLQVKDRYGPDSLLIKAMRMFNTVNQYTNDFASKYGVLKVIQDYDETGDIPIVPDILKRLITTGLTVVPGGVAMIPQAQDFMDNLKLSVRTIVFIVYLMLDGLRLTMSITGSESSRQLLSVGMAVLELLKGNWKAAVFSFMGYFGTTPMLISEYIKIVVYFYDTLAEDKKENIIFGVNSTIKGLIVGILLTIFKVTAPFEVRKPLIEILNKIRENKDKIDGVLRSEELSERPDYLAPTYDDLQNLHALMNDKQFICSCEHRKLIEEVNKSAIIDTILQLMDIPTTDPVYRYKCDKEKCSSFLDLIVEEGLEEKTAKQIAVAIQEELERDAEARRMVDDMNKKKEDLLKEVKDKMKDANPVPSLDDIKIAVMDVLKEVKSTVHAKESAKAKADTKADANTVTEGSTESATEPEEAPKEPEEAPKEPEEVPKEPEEAPKEAAEEAPKEAEKTSGGKRKKRTLRKRA